MNATVRTASTLMSTQDRRRSASSLDIPRIRRDFPILATQVHGKPLVYLDNAATTQKPVQVLDAVRAYYETSNANVHRAIYALGERATQAYEGTRRQVADFIGAADWRSIVFTRGTTEAINLVAYAWARHNLGPGDEIVVTEMEHHSNLVPWQLAARDTGAVLRHIPLTDGHTLDLDQAARIINDRTRLVCMVHQSNVFGTVNPVREITALARKVGALILLDGAQSVPHFTVNVQDLDCDFLAFSGHKMLAPTGVGALYAKLELLEKMEPFLSGGEMISAVTMSGADWNDVPWKFEAGTMNIAQVVGLGAAIDYLNALGMDRLQRHIDDLTSYGRQILQSIPGLTIYGHAPTSTGVISLNLSDVHPHDVAQVLDQEGVAVRAGHHCAQPVMQHLKVPATIRASFYAYTTRAELDRLAEGFQYVQSFMGGKGA